MNLQELKEEYEEVKRKLAVYEDRSEGLIEQLEDENITTIKQAEILRKKKKSEIETLTEKRDRLIEKAEERLEQYE